MSSSIEQSTHVVFDFGGTIFPIESLTNLFEEMLKRNGNPHRLPGILINSIIEFSFETRIIFWKNIQGL